MGLRSFLKNAARALGLSSSSSRSGSTRPVDDAAALDRIEQQVVVAATNRDSIKLLDLWHELSLWKAPPLKAGELKQQLAQLFEEFEGQRVNPNASPSTILVLRSQIAAKQRSDQQKIDKERQAKEEAERLAKEEADRLAREAEVHRAAAEADRLRQEQERQAKEEADRLARVAEAQRVAAEAEQRRQEQEQQASAVPDEEDIPPVDPDELAAERQALRRRIDAVRATLQERQTRSASEDAWVEDLPPQDVVPGGAEPLHDPGLDLEPLAEDVVPLQGEQTAEAPSSDESQEQPSWPKISIGDLSLSTRASNALHYGGVRTVADLAEKQPDDLLNIRNFGQKSLDELIVGLEKQGIPFPVPANPQPEQRENQLATSNLNDKPRLPSATTALRDLGIPQPVLGPLLRSGMKRLEDLAGKSDSDLSEIRNLGPIGIERLRQALADIGLELPFHLGDLDLPTPHLGETHHEIRPTEDDRKQRRDHSIALVSDVAEKYLTGNPGNPEEAIEDLLQNSDLIRGHNSLHTELSILREFLGIIESLLGPIFLNDDLHSVTWQETKRHLLVRYAQELSDATSKSWLNSLQKSIRRDADRGWSSYIRRACGTTYQAIGDQLDPPVTRERVRQLLNRVASVVGVAADALSTRIQGSASEQARAKQLAGIQSWLDRFGRLAFKGDQPQANEDMEYWDAVLAKNPKQRLEIYQEYAIPVPDREWDLHYDWICNSSSSMGNGYWKDFECLKHFLLRHAVALGHPTAMPKQTSLPRRVGGIVQNFGGQSKVARRLGLQYQGQLVGEDGGRTYWTEDKLFKLLDDVNQFHKQDLSVMPSQAQIYDFFKEQVEEPYAGKNPGSPIASMNRQGQLHWSEVASRFGKQFVAGSSTANITLAYIKAFVRDLGEHLEALTPSELYVLFQAQGINRGDKEKFSRTFDRLVDAVQSGIVKREDLQAWADNNDVDSINELLEFGADLKAETNQSDKESLLLQQRSKQLQREFAEEKQIDLISSDDLPQLDPVKTLLALDKAASVVESSTTDADRIEFLKAKATAKLWDACFADADTLINKLRTMNAEVDAYSSEVRSSFLEEYEGARSLEIPSSYRFCDLKGRPRQPKLMQRLVAFRLKRDYRLLNLSGTGTGKTLSAVFAAQVCGCRRILISCPNGVISSWQRTFSSAYPDAVVHIKPDDWNLPELDDRTHVVIVNHERFQNHFRQPLLEFCLSFQADLIVIDEIHQAKRRDQDKSSQRRRLMDQFSFTSGNLNSELRVLGLSATPVINNLFEGRSLIELVSQEAIDGVDEEMDLNACMNLYQHFVVHGIRMNPGQLPRTELVLTDVDATPVLPQVIGATRRGSFHDVEQLLVQPKLDALDACLERGQKTVIFIAYIKSTLDPLCQWLKQHGFSYSVYTGGDKEAHEVGYNDSLDEFIRGSTDVLVASIQCAGTGVDGLQSVCNRAIFLQLPWTSTEFEQAIGRLDRDGTEFDSVKVYLPITEIHLPNGERWSWCRSKLDRIRSKRDIAKAAVDGEVPDEASMISPSKASEYWLLWLKRLENESP